MSVLQKIMLFAWQSIAFGESLTAQIDGLIGKSIIQWKKSV